MKRQAFSLGFFSTGAQVLLLRELVSSFNGDELFIGTALFGWLLSVSLGAFQGGKAKAKTCSSSLFVISIISFWAVMLIIRLTPLLFDKVTGEIFPFTTAAILSIIFMAPTGILSGWLFTAISRESRVETAISIVMVYLYEGAGAFVGGLVIAVFVGTMFSTISMALAIGLVVLANTIYFRMNHPSKKYSVFIVCLTLFLLVVVKNITVLLDISLDSLKYKSYTVEKSFDTSYSHQSLLSCDSTITLLTDNNIEAVYPDLMISENRLLPALAYRPGTSSVLLLGRAEFGLMQLAEKFHGLKISALDPRQTVSKLTDELIPLSETVTRINRDPISYLADQKDSIHYDIIILSPGNPDNHKNNIFYTAEFYDRLKNHLAGNGLLFIPTGYDTDRFISTETGNILAIIYTTLKSSFANVTYWPGDMTLFMASEKLDINISLDTILQRIDNFIYEPSFISENFLTDRLSEFKTERLSSALQFSNPVNRLKRPLLPHYQVLYNSKKSGTDNLLVSFALNQPYWLIILPLIIILFYASILVVGKKERSSRFGLFLYFTAGIISLTFELTIFYVYQSLAGSLYSELALLVGVFMLGLALGTFFSSKHLIRYLELVTLMLLLLLTAVFMNTCEIIPPGYLLLYHATFMFLTAVATGALFVAATRRYYADRPDRNRGFGYALELIGSSLGALLTTTVLLPVIGLQGLMGALIIMIMMAFSGSILTKVG